MNYIRSYEGYTIYFILHALTLITKKLNKAVTRLF